MRNLPARLLFTVLLVGGAAGGLTLLFRAFSLGGPRAGGLDSSAEGGESAVYQDAPVDAPPGPLDAALPDAAADGGPEGVSSAADAAPDAGGSAAPNGDRCAPYLEAGRTAYSLLRDGLPLCTALPLDPPVNTCAPLAGGGAIVARTTYVKCKATGWDAAFAVVRLSAADSAFPKGAGGGALHDGESLKLAEAFDWDGDGVPEVALVVSKPEAADRVLLWTAPAEGPARPYAKAGNLTGVEGVDDVDDDGRPDLLVASPFDGGTPCSENAYAPLPALPMHSQDAGTFAFDEVSRSKVRSLCAGGLGRDVLQKNLKDEGVRLAEDATALSEDLWCARFGGASTPEILAWLRPLCPTFRAKEGCPPDGTPPAKASAPSACEAWVRRLAAVRVPFEVR